jgi:hypothetical protein
MPVFSVLLLIGIIIHLFIRYVGKLDSLTGHHRCNRVAPIKPYSRFGDFTRIINAIGQHSTNHNTIDFCVHEKNSQLSTISE